MIIDLSVPVNEQTPVYPGDPATKIAPAGDIAKDGYCDHYVSIGTHVGTHVDAPAHMLEGGKTLNQIPIEQFVGRGVYIKAEDGFDLATVKSAGIQAGDIVLFHSGMSDNYHDSIYFETYPAMSEEIANFLVEAKVKMVGVDTCSVDNQDGFPIHKTLLAGNVLIIENLTNLAQLADKQFTIYALPLNVQIDGAPARVIAQIN
jgi:arylformamidase